MKKLTGADANDLASEKAINDLRKTVKGAIVPRGTYGNDNAKRCAKKKN